MTIIRLYRPFTIAGTIIHFVVLFSLATWLEGVFLRFYHLTVLAGSFATLIGLIAVIVLIRFVGGPFVDIETANGSIRVSRYILLRCMNSQLFKKEAVSTISYTRKNSDYIVQIRFVGGRVEAGLRCGKRKIEILERLYSDRITMD